MVFFVGDSQYISIYFVLYLQSHQFPSKGAALLWIQAFAFTLLYLSISFMHCALMKQAQEHRPEEGKR